MRPTGTFRYLCSYLINKGSWTSANKGQMRKASWLPDKAADGTVGSREHIECGRMLAPEWTSYWRAQTRLRGGQGQRAVCHCDHASAGASEAPSHSQGFKGEEAEKKKRNTLFGQAGDATSIQRGSASQPYPLSASPAYCACSLSIHA